ncbi:MAG: isoprenylcysteine carboxylmethyltransferase family protein [Candidatus Bathyarchaeota archaeon]|nr:isoprenylcysteine carboxylmethyltransferase family protein [Candidatus Bathyarchaeota archaeon]
MVVILSIALFSLFIVAFLKPFKRRNWASLGITEAFFVSLFTEMFGIPLTIYFLSGFFGIPLTPDPLHGHLFAATLALLGLWTLETGVFVVMVVSILILILSVYLVVAGWRIVYHGKGNLVTKGVYSHVRHPQYLGIILGSVAFLIQWPTIPTLIMFPILTIVYYRLAEKEEIEMIKRFGAKYSRYQGKVPMFLPRF